MITEINGRWTCTKCGYEWSACISDDQVPEVCECEKDETWIDKHSVNCYFCGELFDKENVSPPMSIMTMMVETSVLIA